MDLEKRIDTYKTRYKNASLPDTVKQPYEQILAFVDADVSTSNTADFAGELAAKVQSKLDLFFPVADEAEDIDPEEMVSEQRYDDLNDALRQYERLEGEVTQAILDQVPGEGDETICLLPAPFRLSDDSDPDPGILGEVIENILGQFNHPSLLLRHPPHLPSEDLYDHVVIAGSTLHNILRLVRCTAGVCPDGTTINIAGVADKRFSENMKNLLDESEDYDLNKDEPNLKQTLIDGMERKLKQIATRLDEEHNMTVNFDIHNGDVESAVKQSPYFDQKPTLLSLPLHYSGGGYDASALMPLFKQYTSTEILTI